MADIDLIPQDYRTRLWLQSRVKRTAVSMTAIVILAAGSFGVLNYLAKDIKQDIKLLQEEQAITTQQRDAVTALNEKRKELEHQLTLLGGLRSGASAPTMFVTIDRAIEGGDIWFQSWEFKRAGSVLREEKAEPESNGYFILRPADGDEDTEAWKIETHMTIRGQGRDHSALSRFVRRLFQQPEIQDVRILNSSLASNREFVDFNLAITVHSKGQAADG